MLREQYERFGESHRISSAPRFPTRSVGQAVTLRTTLPRMASLPARLTGEIFKVERLAVFPAQPRRRRVRLAVLRCSVREAASPCLTGVCTEMPGFFCLLKECLLILGVNPEPRSS